MAINREVINLFLAEVARLDLPTPERQPDGSFRLRLGELTHTISLDNLAKDFAEDNDAGRVRNFVEQIVNSASANVVPDWATAEPGLRLVLEPSDFQFHDTLRETISDSACRILAYAMPDDRGILWLMPWMLERWDKTVEEVEAVARANMARLLAETEFVVDEVDGGQLGYFRTNSPFKASLMLAPNFKEVIGPRLGWPLLMVVPLRDLAYVFREEDRQILPRVGAVVVGEFRNGAYPISPEVFRLSDEGIDPIGRFEAPTAEQLRAARDAEEGLKTIVYRGGIVTFRIPDHWEEEYEDDGGGTFYDEDEPGTLRINVLTIEAAETASPDAFEEMLERRARDEGVTATRLPNGNAWVHYQKTSEPDDEDEDEPKRMWFWEILAVLPPRHARLAICSFIIEEEYADCEDTRETVELIQGELEKCEFTQQLGE